MFKSLSPSIISLLNENPTIRDKLSNFFSSYGFNIIKTNFDKTFDKFVEKDLTVYCYIKFEELSTLYTTIEINKSDGTKYTEYCYTQLYEEGENIMLILSTRPIAVYFKERNILYITISLINYIKSYSDNKNVDDLLKDLKICFDKIKFKKVSVSQFYSNLSIKLLKSHITKRILEKKYTLQSHQSSIQEKQENLIYLSKIIFLLTKSIYMYEEMSNNFDTIIRNNLKEVEELKFVKSIEFVGSGIRFNFGKISYEDYIGEGENKEKVKCYLGDYYLIIGENYTIHNKDPITLGDSTYDHMHSGNHTCWGDYNNQLINLLLEYKFKQICMYVYSWLNSYNKEDCILSFDRFYEARKIENKFDVKGNIIKSYKKVLVLPIKVGDRVRLKSNSKHYIAQHDMVGESIIEGMVKLTGNSYSFIFDNGYKNTYILEELEIVK